jgi:hypothetical protein
MPLQQPIDLVTGLAVLVLSVALWALVAAAYSLAATWTVRSYGPRGLTLAWAVVAASLSTAIVWGLRSVATERPGLDTLLVPLALGPVLTTAGSSILIWRLYKRRPDAGTFRFLAHGMVGFGLGFFAVFLTVCVADIARYL